MLNFIALYGLLLLPIGGVVFAEFWLLPKFGLTRYWVAHKKISLNWPALVTWIITIIIALYLWKTNVLHQFFQFIPVWILSIAMYILLSKLAGAKVAGAKDEDVIQKAEVTGIIGGHSIETKRIVNKSILDKAVALVALTALIACIVLPLLVATSKIENYSDIFNSVKTWLILPTIVYFIFGTYWVAKKEKVDAGA
jgi:NCS1 family nucleobase:cation symporter-1